MSTSLVPKSPTDGNGQIPTKRRRRHHTPGEILIRSRPSGSSSRNQAATGGESSNQSRPAQSSSRTRTATGESSNQPRTSQGSSRPRTATAESSNRSKPSQGSSRNRSSAPAESSNRPRTSGGSRTRSATIPESSHRSNAPRNSRTRSDPVVPTYEYQIIPHTYEYEITPVEEFQFHDPSTKPSAHTTVNTSTTPVSPARISSHRPPTPIKTLFIFSRNSRRKLVITTTPNPSTITDDIAYYIVAPDKPHRKWSAIVHAGPNPKLFAAEMGERTRYSPVVAKVNRSFYWKRFCVRLSEDRKFKVIHAPFPGRGYMFAPVVVKGGSNKVYKWCGTRMYSKGFGWLGIPGFDVDLKVNICIPDLNVYLPVTKFLKLTDLCS